MISRCHAAYVIPDWLGLAWEVYKEKMALELQIGNGGPTNRQQNYVQEIKQRVCLRIHETICVQRFRTAWFKLVGKFKNNLNVAFYIP